LEFCGLPSDISDMNPAPPTGVTLDWSKTSPPGAELEARLSAVILISSSFGDIVEMRK
jgi:hypothetical protein